VQPCIFQLRLPHCCLPEILQHTIELHAVQLWGQIHLFRTTDESSNALTNDEHAENATEVQSAHVAAKGIDPYEVSRAIIHSTDIALTSHQVCRAAATKPFGYSNFTPSAGGGGHCIPVNPYYLLSTSDFPILNHATQTMAMRPSMIASRMMRRAHIKFGMQLAKKYYTLVVGAGFKAGQAVLSHSPGISMMTALKEKWKAEVAFMDHLVKDVPGFRKLQEEEWNSDSLEMFHLIIVVISQPGVNTKILQSLRVPIVHYCHERLA